ncbi:MAG: hypothetical protein JW819_07425 [Candidatus Krumholzibacteriota bacterium]|nr:hypothetical protein [Candidatus Krumholzibacteriota bacterium]
MSLLPGHPTRTWDPDSRRGEGVHSRDALRRRDVWFFVGLVLFALLLWFVWQQNRGLRLAGEVASLEAERDALRARILELGVAVARERQPERLLRGLPAAQLASRDLDGRIFIPVAAGDLPRRESSAWLASAGITVPAARAADGH